MNRSTKLQGLVTLKYRRNVKHPMQMVGARLNTSPLLNPPKQGPFMALVRTILHDVANVAGWRLLISKLPKDLYLRARFRVELADSGVPPVVAGVRAATTWRSFVGLVPSSPLVVIAVSMMG